MIVNIKLDEHGLASAFRKKASETQSEFTKFTKDLVDIARDWVRDTSPRRTGKMKASVTKQHNGTTGMVYFNKGIAYYVDWVIDGHRTRPFIKTSGVQKWVPGNPVVDKAIVSMQGEINRRTAVFENWLEAV